MPKRFLTDFRLKLSTLLAIFTIWSLFDQVLLSQTMKYGGGGSLSLKYFHVFGCTCYILSDRDPRKKLNSEGDEDEVVTAPSSIMSHVTDGVSNISNNNDEESDSSEEEDDVNIPVKIRNLNEGGHHSK